MSNHGDQLAPRWGSKPPPQDDGRRLATLPRASKDGKPQELRISLAEFEGNKFVKVRLWEAAAGGEMVPTRVGSTFRRGELAEAIRALQAADRELNPPPLPGRRRADLDDVGRRMRDANLSHPGDAPRYNGP